MSVQSLAQALVEAGILDANQAGERILRAHTGRQLLDGVIKDGVATEKNLVAHLARALSVPRYDPRERHPEPEALASLDAETALRLSVLPVVRRGGGMLLWVATCDPTDEETLGEISRKTGLRVKPCLIGPRELDRALAISGVGPAYTQAFVAPSVALGAARGLSPSPVPTMRALGSTPVPSPLNQTRPLLGSVSSLSPHLRPPPPSPPPSMPSIPALAPLKMPPSKSPELKALEDELAQARQVVRVLSQMLVERGVLDGDEFKRRLRLERERERKP